MHEALFVVDKMTIKDRTYVEILTVIWGLYNTAAWKGLKFKQGKSIPNRTLCISTSLKIRRKSSHCRSSVKHCLCFTKKDRKIGSWIYHNLSGYFLLGTPSVGNLIYSTCKTTTWWCVVPYVVVSNVISPFVSEQSISHAYEEIASCKTELQQAKRIRRNRQGIINGSKIW